MRVLIAAVVAFLTAVAPCLGQQRLAALPVPTASPPPGAPSTISVQLGVDLSQLSAQLTSYVPHTISENPSRQCIQWGVYGGPVAVSGYGNKLEAVLTLYWRGGQRCGIGDIGHASCGWGDDPMKRMVITATSDISWNPNYSVSAAPSINVSFPDACNVTVLNVDVRKWIQSKAQDEIDRFSSSLPGYIAKATNFQPDAAKVWSALETPIEVVKAPATWLVVHPQSFEAAPPSIDAKSNTLMLTAALVAQPDVIRAQSAPAPNEAPLPPLKVAPVTHH